MSDLIQVKRSSLCSPAATFYLAWLFVSGLYLLGYSSRLYYGYAEILGLLWVVFSAFWVGAFLPGLFRRIRNRKFFEIGRDKFLDTYAASLKLYYFIIFLSLLEFLVEGYVPAISIFGGQSVSHFEFGIPSLHGLILSAHLYFSMVGVIAFSITRKRLYLLPLVFTVTWALLIVSRKLFMVAILQSVVLWVILYGINFRKLARYSVLALLVLALFGTVGQHRSGSHIMTEFGGFGNESLISNYPVFQWSYLYFTTPLHNIIYAKENYGSEGNIFFNRTFSPLVPSAIASALSGKRIDPGSRFEQAGKDRYWLESRVFNVSTAGIEPYIDMGNFGIWMFFAVIGLLSSFCYYHLSGYVGLTSSVIFISAGILSIYSNNFTNLNFVGQFLWLSLFHLCSFKIIVSNRYFFYRGRIYRRATIGRC